MTAEGMAVEIWDLHCHLSGLPGRTPEERLERLVAIADRMGIRRLCVFMGLELAYDPSPQKLREDNDQVLRALERFRDRAFGFAYLNPRHPEASLCELDRCVRDGPMVGVKLWVAERCSAPSLDPLVRRATELKALVFQHTWIKATGNLPGESTPQDLAQLAARHPQAAIVCGHAGGDWEQGIRAVRAHPNVSVDLGGGDPVAGITEMAVRELGAERVLYGSDAGGRSFASQRGLRPQPNPSGSRAAPCFVRGGGSTLPHIGRDTRPPPPRRLMGAGAYRGAWSLPRRDSVARSDNSRKQ